MCITWNLESLRLDALNDCHQTMFKHSFPLSHSTKENWLHESHQPSASHSCQNLIHESIVSQPFPRNPLKPFHPCGCQLPATICCFRSATLYPWSERWIQRDSILDCTLWISAIIAPQNSCFILCWIQFAHPASSLESRFIFNCDHQSHDDFFILILQRILCKSKILR